MTARLPRLRPCGRGGHHVPRRGQARRGPLTEGHKLTMSQSSTDSLSGKIITVLGGSGFLGKHLAQELLSRGARLRIASRNPQRAFAI
ncbi:MAG TPA: NAD-dependent epimerase/dehydratase family protein, partial [Sphingobium sp.]|nr:NAD-dependent epimerase/dehydratase family protein [Sphingobium sp.]